MDKVTQMKAVSFITGDGLWGKEDSFSLSFSSGFLSGCGETAFHHFQVVGGRRLG